MKTARIFKSGSLAALLFIMVNYSTDSSFARGGACHAAREARFDRRHPRRSEVLDRSGNINHRLNADKGNLDGHYGQLKREDTRVHRQEQRDAALNGGHITTQEQAHLNREENRINRQIRRDQ